MTLTVADIERWSSEAVRSVFHVGTARARHVRDTSRALQALRVFDTWKGAAADASRHSVAQTRQDLDAHGAEVAAVAEAARRAADDIDRVQGDLRRLKIDLEDKGLQVDPASGRIVRMPHSTHGVRAQQAAIPALQVRLDAIVADANAVDRQLALAINMVDGDAPVAGPGTWQEMLLPPDAAGTDPAPTLRDALFPPGTTADPDSTPKTLDDVLFPPGTPQPGPPPSMLNRLNANRQAAGKPPLSSLRDDTEFIASARNLLGRQGLSPDQIEQQINAAIALSEQPLSYTAAPDPRPQPAPGFIDGFRDRWFSTEEALKALVGNAGPKAPGIVESWSGLLTGTAETITNPVGAIKDEIDHALNSPSTAYYAGEKAFDVGAAAATLPFGGEGAAIRAGLPAEIATAGGAPAAILRDWNPAGGMPWEDFESRFGTPEARLWPGNDGFPPGYLPQPVKLPEGTIIDRFGSEYGRYLAPDGTPFADRALAPESVGGDYNRYIVTGKPLPAGWQFVQGPVEPWYGQTPSPGTVQYMIVGPDGVRVNVKELIDRGILDDYGPPLGR